MRPGGSRLVVDPPICLRNIIRFQQSFALRHFIKPFPELGAFSGEELAGWFRVHDTVNDHMRHMNPLRAQLARHRLGQRAFAHLCRAKRREPCPASSAGGGACDNDRARPPPLHPAR